MSPPDPPTDGPTGDSEGGDDLDGRWILVTGRPIVDGWRVEIPKWARDQAGIERGDVVDVRVYREFSSEQEDPIELPEALVRTRNRVSIPEHQAALRGFSVGDRIDLQIRDTGKDYQREGEDDSEER